MDKKKILLIQYALLIVICSAIFFLLIYIKKESKLNITTTFAPDLNLIDNPMMGFAPDAQNAALCEDTSLVFITLPWSEWEPSEGKYDIDGFEKKYNVKKWKEEHKYAVLRFVCDIPGNTDHYDVPTWLYNKISNGKHYSTNIGKGYSPDYSDSTFREYHKKAIENLAKYCNKDHFVAFVELGSMGHWGEWHATDGSRSLMPGEDICNEYLALYSNNFVNSKLLVRRNYETAVNGGLGFYNDMLGSKEETAQWLDWLKNGGEQETSSKSIKLEPVKDPGIAEPVGGEFASSVPMTEVLGNNIGDVLSDISASGMTFIGPNIPNFNSKDFSLASESILKRMGYRIYVSDLKTQYDFSSNMLSIELTFKNAGAASFYFDWPVTISVFDKNREQIFWESVDLDIRELDSEEGVVAITQLPVSEDIRDEFYIGVSITDYEKNNFIKLAIDSDEPIEYVDHSQLLYHYKK